MPIADLEIRPDSREVLGRGKRVQLTRRELEVLMVLVEQPDRVITRATIYAQVWGGHMPYRDRGVDVYVRRVREKLRSLAPDARFIHTHFGIGYRFWPQSAAQKTVRGFPKDR
ncbi:MAG: response regulator transcription factor [Thermoleophilia bacterium]|nr:response regulator transcription factor [Thermoleophilia bacterium]